jgi:hypothetical protein
MTTAAAMRGVPYTLQSAATTGNGNIVSPPPSFIHHTITIKGLTAIAAGAVQIETADDDTYTGTWGQIGGGPITVVDVTEIVVNFEGVFKFIRARISTTVTGGTVTVTYNGAP